MSGDVGRNPLAIKRCDGAAAVRLLAILAGLVITGTLPAAAQGWFDGITGFGTPDGARRRAEERAKLQLQPDVMEDLRADDTPWRSDEMLISIDRAIRRYEKVVSAGGWPRIDGSRMMRPGDDDDRMPVLRKILRGTGDLKTSSGGFEGYGYDANVEAAVRSFQERHGLRPTGRADKVTLAAMNISAEERLEQLRLNYKRVSELLVTPLEDRYVLVNVPAFQLEAVNRFQVAQRHRVIVGRPERETPSLVAHIKGVNFFPFWKVPESVAQLDLIPKLAKEPDYLTKENIRVLQGDFNGQEIDATYIDWSQVDTKVIRFRQDPGPRNALGLVRIDMQNEHGVYMHDTPLKELFGQRARPFSAGCVRVQDPFKLVEWLTSLEPGWEQPGRVEEVLQSGQAVDLALTVPVPVYFTYITAWAEKSGEVQFRSDVYNRDGRPAEPQLADFDPDAPPPPQPGLAP